MALKPTGDPLDHVFPAVPAEPLEGSVAIEADRLVSGDRLVSYGHPWKNFSLTAEIATPLLKNKLKDGVSLTPEDVALFMVAVKLAREVHKHKRDNLVDAIGYLKCLDLIVQRRAEMESGF